MATRTNQQVTLADVLKNRGIEIPRYVTNKEQWAKDEVVFCVKRIEKHQGKINDEPVEQWMFTIITKTPSGEPRTFLLPVPLNEIRDEVVEALTDELAKLPENARIIHGLMLEAIPLKKYANPYYAIVPASEKNLKCQCEN